MLDLFSDTPPWQEPLAPGAVLRRFAPRTRPGAAAGDSRRRQSVAVSPDGHAGGYTMSVAATNCGALAGLPIATAICTPRSTR